MPFNDLLNEIESPRFAAAVGIESGAKQVMRSLATQPGIGLLLNLMARDRSYALHVLERAIARSVQTVDVRYENPMDIAITTYLYCLDSVYPDLALILAEVALSAQNTWWSPQFAQYVLDRGATSAGLEFEQISTSQPSKVKLGTPMVHESVLVTRILNGLFRQNGRMSHVNPVSDINIPIAEDEPIHAQIQGQRSLFEKQPMLNVVTDIESLGSPTEENSFVLVPA